LRDARCPAVCLGLAWLEENTGGAFATSGAHKRAPHRRS